MFRIYVFNEFNSNWIEENDSILYHDLCAIFDENNNSIYLWKGPKMSKNKYKLGQKTLESLLAKFPEKHYTINNFSKETPKEIVAKIDNLLETVKKEENLRIYNFSRFTTIRLFIIFQLALIILPIISYINLLSSLTWEVSAGSSEVSAGLYSGWLNISLSLTILILILYIFNVIIGLVELEYQVITYSILGIIISIGLIVYFQQGVFLFLFQAGSTQYIFYIAQTDLNLFLILIGISSILLELPNLLKFISVLRIYKRFIF
jgi:hypothetical protein